MAFTPQFGPGYVPKLDVSPLTRSVQAGNEAAKRILAQIQAKKQREAALQEQRRAELGIKLKEMDPAIAISEANRNWKAAEKELLEQYITDSMKETKGKVTTELQMDVQNEMQRMESEWGQIDMMEARAKEDMQRMNIDGGKNFDKQEFDNRWNKFLETGKYDMKPLELRAKSISEWGPQTKLGEYVKQESQVVNNKKTITAVASTPQDKRQYAYNQYKENPAVRKGAMNDFAGLSQQEPMAYAKYMDMSGGNNENAALQYLLDQAPSKIQPDFQETQTYKPSRGGYGSEEDTIITAKPVGVDGGMYWDISDRFSNVPSTGTFTAFDPEDPSGATKTITPKGNKFTYVGTGVGEIYPDIKKEDIGKSKFHTAYDVVAYTDEDGVDQKAYIPSNKKHLDRVLNNDRGIYLKDHDKVLNSFEDKLDEYEAPVVEKKKTVLDRIGESLGNVFKSTPEQIDQKNKVLKARGVEQSGTNTETIDVPVVDTEKTKPLPTEINKEKEEEDEFSQFLRNN